MKHLKCRECLSVVEGTRQNEHCCDENKCDICKTFVFPGHFCFTQALLCKRKIQRSLIVISFYFTILKQTNHAMNNIVNFAVMQYGDEKEFVFEDYDSLDRFCKFLLSSEHKVSRPLLIILRV